MSYENWPISKIAKVIKADWKTINPAAEDNLEAMFHINEPTDTYYADDGDTIVRYFLSNSKGWKGDTAREVKAALKKICKIR